MIDLLIASLGQLVLGSLVAVLVARWLLKGSAIANEPSRATENTRAVHRKEANQSHETNDAIADKSRAVDAVDAVDAAGATEARLARPARARIGLGLAVGAAALIAVYLLWFRDHAWLADTIPTTAVPALSDPMPVLAGIVIGVLAAQRRLPRWRRTLWGIGVAMVALWPMTQMLFPSPPRTGAAWSGVVCLQTTDVTCGPAAAATLLGHHGIEATEAELTVWCLTRKGSSYGRRFGSGLGAPGGTHLMGLMRGLRIGSQNTPVKARAASMTLDDFRDGAERWPAIVSVRLTEEVHAREPKYADRWGWNVGVAHTLVVYGFDNTGRVRVGDPGIGAERWDLRALEDLWTGEVVWLESRE